MAQITLLPETIKEIKSYFDNYNDFEDLDPYDGSDWEQLEDIEFKQGNIDIMVDGNIYARFIKGMRSHDYDVPDDPDEFVNDGYEITGVAAFDEDGEEVEITNANELLKAA